MACITKFEPMKPAPPVTRIVFPFMFTSLLANYLRDSEVCLASSIRTVSGGLNCSQINFDVNGKAIGPACVDRDEVPSPGHGRLMLLCPLQVGDVKCHGTYVIDILEAFFEDITLDIARRQIGQNLIVHQAVEIEHGPIVVEAGFAHVASAHDGGWMIGVQGLAAVDFEHLGSCIASEMMGEPYAREHQGQDDCGRDRGA